MLPVIIYHRGGQHYVKTVLEEALRHHNIVYLIGDSSNAHFPCTEFYHYEPLQEQSPVNTFYKHASPNNAAFEKVCIQRWFTILNLMRLKRLQRAFVCDSDVLIFENLASMMTTDKYPLPVYISTTNTKYSVTAGQSLWTLNALQKFTEFITAFYQRTNWKRVEQCWENYPNKLSGGISDMYLLYCFLTGTGFEDHKFHIMPPCARLRNRDLSQIMDGKVFDNSIDLLSDGFESYMFEHSEHQFPHQNMGQAIKKVWWKRGRPFGRLRSQGIVRFVSLHFHGCKELISPYAEKSRQHKSISAVIFSLNDDYSPDMKERFVLCVNCLSECVDEIVYIDWGSPHGVSLLEIPEVHCAVSNPAQIKHLKFSRREIANIVPPNCNFIQQPIIRNIGIRHCSCDYILSTNIDILTPSYTEVQALLRQDDGQTFYSVNRKNVCHRFVLQHAHFHPTHLRSILQNHVEQRQYQIDTEPEVVFQQQSLNDIAPTGDLDLYHAHQKYTKIWNCGDFQLAHRRVWYTIKGFEEGMILTAHGTDSVVQKKVCAYGFRLRILNNPPLYHINHSARSSHNPKEMNDMRRFFIDLTKSENPETWGLVSA